MIASQCAGSFTIAGQGKVPNVAWEAVTAFGSTIDAALVAVLLLEIPVAPILLLPFPEPHATKRNSNANKLIHIPKVLKVSSHIIFLHKRSYESLLFPG
jgi:hypothetical protein